MKMRLILKICEEESKFRQRKSPRDKEIDFQNMSFQKSIRSGYSEEEEKASISEYNNQ